jgi:hypothetical protein
MRSSSVDDDPADRVLGVDPEIQRMLYGLYFFTCLVGNPAHCVMRVHAFDEDISTPQHCLTVAQPQMAQWQNQHGDRWRVESFRCGKPPRDRGNRV